MVVFIVIAVYIILIWNSTKSLENTRVRISYSIIGTLCIALITFIIFLFSKIGVEYQDEDMTGYVRNVILLIFVPLNGIIVLPQVANLISRIKNGNITKEDSQKRVRIILIICIVVILFECVYFKNIQNGIINYINAKLYM